MQIASRISPLISPENLHRLWQRVPRRIRSPIARSSLPGKCEDATHAKQRNEAMLQFVEQFDCILSPSQYLADRAMEQGVPNVRVFRHGVEEFRDHIGGQGFIFLATMVKHKGPDVVARAYDLAQPNREVPIRFYGAGDMKINHPVSPPLYRKEVWNALQHSDALIIGSIWPENAPMIISEARAVGCPIIAPNIGGIPELVEDGVDGHLYRAGDIVDCAAKITQLLTQKLSPRAPKSLSSSLQEYHDLYRSLTTPQEVA